jgi:hypothetical protein
MTHIYVCDGSPAFGLLMDVRSSMTANKGCSSTALLLGVFSKKENQSK